MDDHPEKFGLLFQTETDEKYALPVQRVFLVSYEVMEKYMKPINNFCEKSNLCPFMIAASYKESTVNAIYHLLRQLGWMNSCISSFEGNALKNKK